MRILKWFIVFIIPKSIFSFKIGLLIVATGRYIEFIPNLVSQSKQYFLPNHEVTHFIFTDMPLEPKSNIVICYQEKLKWPYSTMLRYETYLQYKDLYEDYDYLFACDADTNFIGLIDEIILAQSTAVLFPAFTLPKMEAFKDNATSPHLIYDEKYWDLLQNEYTHEKSPHSLAYLPNGKFYFCGGIFGGEKKYFLDMLELLATRIQTDIQNNIIPTWHEESHLNWYFNTYLPERILSPFYCYFDYATYHTSFLEPNSPKILCLSKDVTQYHV